MNDPAVRYALNAGFSDKKCPVDFLARITESSLPVIKAGVGALAHLPIKAIEIVSTSTSKRNS
jgi:hypothetical protein